MATSGKKANKKKPVTISLQTFLANDNTPPGVTRVAKIVRNIGDDSDEDSGETQIYNLQLPTAPRASRMFDDDSVPHKPPYLAYITNLPFDVKEDDLYDFFHGTKILNLRLPREDCENGRIRGYGHITFENRDDLIYAISIPDPTIHNRRVRIDVANDIEYQQRRGTCRARFEGLGSTENRDSTNWRSGKDGAPREDVDRRGRSGGWYRDRPSHDASTEPGSWRTGDRPTAADTSPGRRSGFSDRYGSARRNGYDDEPQERPKLNLKPRTLPVDYYVSTLEPPKPKSTGVAAEKVFGRAKPVDTAAREKVIDERLEQERLKKEQQLEQEKQEHEQDRKDDRDKEKEADVDEKEIEEQTEKDEKENRNTISWRRRYDNFKSDEVRKYNGPTRRNDRVGDRTGSWVRRDGRDDRDPRDYNRGFDKDNRTKENRERFERSDRENNKERYRESNKDGKPYPDDKLRRDFRPMPKYRPRDAEPLLISCNKFSSLDEGEA